MDESYIRRVPSPSTTLYFIPTTEGANELVPPSVQPTLPFPILFIINVFPDQVVSEEMGRSVSVV